MAGKPTYEKLEEIIRKLQEESVKHKKIENEQKETIARLQTLIHAIPDIVYFKDNKGVNIVVNKAFEELTGLDQKDIIGKTDAELLPPDLAEYCRKSDEQAMKSTKAIRLNEQTTGSNGETIVFDTIKSPIFDRQGNPLGLVGVSRDVTYIKKAEEALRESEERYKSLFKNNHSVMLLIDPKTADIVDANPAAVSFYGWSYETLTCMKITDINTLTEQQVFGEMEKAKTEQRKLFYFQHRLADGKIRDVEVYSGPIKVHGRELLYSIIHDTTASRKAEAALKESEEQFRYISEQSLLAIQIIQDDVFKYLNQASANISGYSIEEMMGWGPEEFAKLIHPDDRKFVMNQVRKKQKSEKDVVPHYQFRIITKSGETRWLEVYSRTIRYKGKFADLATLIDITERKRAEEEKAALEAQLLHTQKMESIGTLSGGIAHDFNNLLSIILGNTEMAMDDVPEWHPARLNLNEIQTASLRARDVVRQLLSFGRKTDPKQRPVKLVQIVEDELKFLRSSIPTSIEIRQNIQIDTDDTIFADSSQINQVIINLFTNAAHAMEDTGGVITIGIEKIYLDQISAPFYPDLSPGNYVKLTVSDTGTGIDPEIADRIFDPYFTTREIGKGTGIGLSVVHGIVKSHNGAISVDSEVGKGTTFSILFPVAEQEAVIETEAVEKLPTGNERILFVDDEKSMAEIGRHRLERLGYKVEAKTNPIEALELFRADPDQFDIVITDMTMPHITGDKLVKEILKIRPDIPTILCTGFSEKIDEEKAKKIGIRGYIEKPFDRGTLSRIVRNVLDHSS